MKKLTTIALFSALLLLMINAAAAFDFSIPGPGVGVAPGGGSPTSLYTFTTTYAYGDGSGRNSGLPGYEYQYENDVVHFHATIRDDLTDLQNMEVVVRIRCPPVGAPVENVFDVPMTGPVSTTSVGALHEGQFFGNFVIPSAINQSGNCMIRVRMRPLGAPSWTVDNLTDPIHTNVDDLLMNPLIGFTAAAPFTFANPQYNAYVASTPEYVDYQLTSIETDREGDGVIGDLFVEMPRYRALLSGGGLDMDNSTPHVFPASNVRFHLDTTPPIVWTDLVNRANLLSAWAPIDTGIAIESMVPQGAGTSSHIRLFWQLYFSGQNLPYGYVSDPTAFNGGNILFQYSIY